MLVEVSMPRKTKKGKQGLGILGWIEKGLDVAAKNAPKIERVYRAASNMKRLADKASEYESVCSRETAEADEKIIRPRFR